LYYEKEEGEREMLIERVEMLVSAGVVGNGARRA
jgi:hypothetical protein